MRIDRMVGILSILLQKEKVTASYLAKVFEVSRRTVNRDIEALCMAGIPLVTERGAGGGISIMDGCRIDRTLLSSVEMQAILAGLRSLDSVSGSGRYARLMEKLSVGASDILTGNQHILIDLSSWYKDALAPKIEQIHDAILSARVVSFTYYAPRGESERTVEPCYLIFQWTDWYVWGFCLLRQEFRLFKLNRMTDLRTGDAFAKRPVPLPDLSPEKVFPQAYQVKARIDPVYRWRLIEEYGPDCFIEEPDGMLLFSFGFADRESIVRWIISFGEGAKLLEPEEMRQDVVRAVSGILEKYAY